MNRQIGGSVDDRSCRYCDRHVSDRFCVAFGDEDGVAHRCLGCDCFRRISRGSAAGVDDVAGDLENYLETKEPAEELDGKIAKIDALIEQLVYELYDLTDGETEAAEETVNSE